MTTPHHVRPPHHELPRGSRYDGVGHDATHTPRPRLSTAPPGLFAPAPEVVAEKVVKPPKPKRRPSRANPNGRRTPQLLPCGTNAAYRRHRAAGETPCRECKAARAEYNSNRLRVKRINVVQIRKDCGTESGVAEHARRKEKLCPHCIQFRQSTRLAS